MMNRKVSIIAGLLLLALGLGSCGMFQKKCNCPHFEAHSAATVKG